MLQIRITEMRIQIRLFTSLRIRIRLSLWCGSGSGFFCCVRILIKVMQICYTGLHTLHGSIVGDHGSDVSASKAAGFSLWSGSGSTLPKWYGSRSLKLVWRARLESSRWVALLITYHWRRPRLWLLQVCSTHSYQIQTPYHGRMPLTMWKLHKCTVPSCISISASAV